MQKNDNPVRMLSKVLGEINLFTGLCILQLTQPRETHVLFLSWAEPCLSPCGPLGLSVWNLVVHSRDPGPPHPGWKVSSDTGALLSAQGFCSLLGGWCIRHRMTFLCSLSLLLSPCVLQKNNPMNLSSYSGHLSGLPAHRCHLCKPGSIRGDGK